jgi:hypothetical protein
MLVSLHKQATTTPRIRAAIQASDEPAWVLADRYGISEQTVWITFHWREMTSSVLVMSSPIFTIRSEPEQVQAEGASTTTRSRSRCSGNGFFTGLRRSKL